MWLCAKSHISTNILIRGNKMRTVVERELITLAAIIMVIVPGIARIELKSVIDSVH